MPISDKPHSYSQVLSAAICLSFSFSAAGQSTTSSAPATNQESAITQQQRSLAVQRQSIERQRAATSQQSGTLPYPRVGSSGFQYEGGYASNPGAANRPDCPPVSAMALQNIVQNAAAANNVSASLINAVIHQESGGYPCAVSDKGAMGLMQLMPATAIRMGAAEPFDANQNVAAGTRLLAELIQRYKGDLIRVLGAYNAGAGAVDRAGGAPPFPETTDYIHSVLEQIKVPFDPKLFDSPIR
jgi:soluble lytic murein transglycosylase-like protein